MTVKLATLDPRSDVAMQARLSLDNELKLNLQFFVLLLLLFFVLEAIQARLLLDNELKLNLQFCVFEDIFFRQAFVM